MSKILPALVSSAALASGSAFAGGLDAPVIEPQVIAEDSGSSGSHDWIVPLFLVLFSIAASN